MSVYICSGNIKFVVNSSSDFSEKCYSTNMRIWCLFVIITTVNAGFLSDSGGHNNQHGNVEVIRVIHIRGDDNNNGYGTGGGGGHYKILKIISEKNLSPQDSTPGSGSTSHGNPQLIKVVHEQSSSIQGSYHGTPSKVLHVIHEHKYPQPTPAYASFPQYAPLPLAQPSSNYFQPQTAPQSSAPVPASSYNSGPVSQSSGSYSYPSPVSNPSGSGSGSVLSPAVSTSNLPSSPAVSTSYLPPPNTQAQAQRVPAQNYGPAQ